MLWHIAKKEFYQNIITTRFITGTIICVLFVILVKISLLSEYEIQIDAYNRSVNTNEERMQNYFTYSEIAPSVHKPPELLSLFSMGKSKKLGGIISIDRNRVPDDSEHYVYDNPLLKVFKSIDIVLVFKLIMSLLALLFAFDMFSGEKETGTLKLSLTGNVSRAELFMGKYFGGILSLSIALLISFLVGLLILTNSEAVKLSSEIITRIILIYFVSILFVASFFSIGALISSRTHLSVTSLAVSLVVWIILVIILPNLGDYLAARFKTVEPLSKIEAEERTIRDEFYKLLDDYQEENPEPEGGTVISGSQSFNRGFYRFHIANLNQMKFHDHFIPFSEAKRREYARRIYAIRKGYLDSLHDQAKIVNMLTIFSPVRLYENISSKLARTDLSDYLKFLEQSRIYRDQMLQYFEDKDVYNKYRFTCVMERGEAPDVSSESVFIEGSEGDKLYDAVRAKVNFDTRPPLNMEDFPRFDYSLSRLNDSLFSVLPLFAGMVFFISVLVLLTYFSFVKYDVR